MFSPDAASSSHDTSSLPSGSLPPLPVANAEARIEGAHRSPGIALAKACLFGIENRTIPLTLVPPEKCDAEVERFESACKLLRLELEQLITEHYDMPSVRVGMRDTMLLLTERNQFFIRTVEFIRECHWSAPYACQSVIDSMASTIADDSVLDRRYELLDLKERLLDKLDPPVESSTQRIEAILAACPGEKIIVAKDMSPAQSLLLSNKDVKAVVLLHAGPLSHVDMLVHDLGVPFVSNVDPVRSCGLRQGEELIVDGDTGWVTVRPTEASRAEALAKITVLNPHNELTPLGRRAPRTQDGRQLRIYGDLLNIGKIDELQRARLTSLGLVRTEMMLIKAGRWLDEETQRALYREILEGVSPHDVTFRTFDLGDDKMGELGTIQETQTGLRGISYALNIRPKELKTQLRAMILAASDVGSDVRIMFPMVIDVSHMRDGKRFYEAAMTELLEEGRIAAPPLNIKLGAMIETSSSVILIDAILKECEFISIGTNDLLTSTLDGDRNHATGAHYHPAFLASVRRVVNAAAEAGKPVSVCGDMPRRPRNVPLWIGLGVTEVVIPAKFVEAVNDKIGRCTTKECSAHVEELIKSGDSKAALQLHYEFLMKLRDRKSS